MKQWFALPMGLALLALTALPSQAAASGEQIFKDKGCTDCHYTQGPARETSIEAKLAQKGPELWYAGDKFQQKWLENWLGDPKLIRPLKLNSLSEKNAGDHPKLAAADAKAVTAFLMGLTSGQVKSGVIKPKKNTKGKRVFTEKMPCSGCHLYPGKKGKVAGGLSAPSMMGASERLNPDWIFAYMMKPEVFKPVKMMPVFNGFIKESDMKKVSAHIASFK